MQIYNQNNKSYNMYSTNLFNQVIKVSDILKCETINEYNFYHTKVFNIIQYWPVICGSVLCINDSNSFLNFFTVSDTLLSEI